MSFSYSDRHFQAQLQERLDLEINDRASQIMRGYAATFEEYRERVGYITALRDARGWMDQIVEAMNTNPKRAA